MRTNAVRALDDLARAANPVRAAGMKRPIGLWIAIAAGAARILLSIATLPFIGKRRPRDR
jgi:hypothetical protein